MIWYTNEIRHTLRLENLHTTALSMPIYAPHDTEPKKISYRWQVSSIINLMTIWMCMRDEPRTARCCWLYWERRHCSDCNGQWLYARSWAPVYCVSTELTGTAQWRRRRWARIPQTPARRDQVQLSRHQTQPTQSLQHTNFISNHNMGIVHLLTWICGRNERAKR